MLAREAPIRGNLLTPSNEISELYTRAPYLLSLS